MRPSFENQLSSMDDFRVHNEDTQDILDWLDDDTAAKKKKVEPTIDISLDDSGDEGNAPVSAEDKGVDGGAFGDEDDFDFDQMLAVRVLYTCKNHLKVCGAKRGMNLLLHLKTTSRYRGNGN